MKTLLTATALTSLLVIGGTYTSLPVSAQDNPPCVGENCPGSGMQGQEPNQKPKGAEQNDQGAEGMPDQTYKKKRQMQGSGEENEMGDQMKPRKKRAYNQQNNDNDDVDVNVRARVDAGDGKWRFDPNRQQRRQSKSATFRFYYGGYWYPQPYWEIYGVRPGRVSCGEGRAIVAERFNRVRVVECAGGTYTYLGRREGDTFRILLNARTGRIVGRALI